jgi:hypothetical protein
MMNTLRSSFHRSIVTRAISENAPTRFYLARQHHSITILTAITRIDGTDVGARETNQLQ